MQPATVTRLSTARASDPSLHWQAEARAASAGTWHPDTDNPTRSPGASGQAGRVRAWQQYQATELASESGPVGQGRAGTAGWDSVRNLNSNRVTRPGWESSPSMARD